MKLSGSYQINLEKQKVWEALVTLENFEGGTKLTYTVEQMSEKKLHKLVHA